VSSSSIEVRPLTQHIGAELHGLDVAGGLADAAFAALHAALLEHHVVFVPDQFLDPPALLAVGGRFGAIDRYLSDKGDYSE
jgi:taurine dioxygenase